MNGVTGRMGLNQHLRRSIYALMQQGGLRLSDQEVIMPRPILVGRNAIKLEAISRECGGVPWTTNLDEALANPEYQIYFDSQTTDRRLEGVSAAIKAGKHIYCEKPIADKTEDALALYEQAKAAGVKHGVVQDKLWLPGLLKLKHLKDLGFFGKILSVRGEFVLLEQRGDFLQSRFVHGEAFAEVGLQGGVGDFWLQGFNHADLPLVILPHVHEHVAFEIDLVGVTGGVFLAFFGELLGGAIDVGRVRIFQVELIGAGPATKFGEQILL